MQTLSNPEQQQLAPNHTVDITARTFSRCLLALFLLGLTIRIAFFIEHAKTPSFGVPTLDQKYYDLVARMLLRGEDLHQLHGFRPLLYPIFLAVFYRIGGAWGVDLAIFVQHLLGVATGIIVALLGARLFRNRLSGVLGGALFLLAPVPLYFEGELLIEPSYTFLICAALLLHLRAAESTGRKSAMLWLAGGAMTVLIAQARANMMVFLAVYPAFAAWGVWRSRQWKAALPVIGLLGGLAMAVPWGIINMRQSDHFHLLPNAGGVALYLGNKRSADGMVPEQERRILSTDRYEDSIEVWAREEYETAMRAQGQQPQADPMAVSRYWTKRTLREIKADPPAWLHLMLKKTWMTFWNAEIPNNKAFAFLQQDYAWLRLLPVRWVVLLMLAPVAIWAAFKKGNRDAFFILSAFAILYSGANIAFFICDRYRYPVWPVMAAFAGGGLLACYDIILSRHRRAAGWIAGAAVLMAVLSLHNWFGAKLPSFSRDYLFRSFAWYEKGHFEEALLDVDKSIALDDREATAVHHRGNVLLALDRLNEAVNAYQQALRLSPGEAGIWNNLGVALEKLSRLDEALIAFRRATVCEPPSMNAFLAITLIEIRAQRFDGASEFLSQLEKREGSANAPALALRSVLARAKGDTGKADALEQKARALDPAAAEWALKEALRSNAVSKPER